MVSAPLHWVCETSLSQSVSSFVTPSCITSPLLCSICGCPLWCSSADHPCLLGLLNPWSPSWETFLTVVGWKLPTLFFCAFQLNLWCAFQQAATHIHKATMSHLLRTELMWWDAFCSFLASAKPYLRPSYSLVARYSWVGQCCSRRGCHTLGPQFMNPKSQPSDWQS